MAEPFVGEIALFSFNNIPRGWSVCNGAALAIQGNQALFSLIGTTYGGDGRTTFNLPDLRGRTVVGASGTPKAPPYGLGVSAGQDQVALAAANLPQHNHNVMTTATAGNAGGANNIVYAQVSTPSAANLYGPMSSPPVAIDPSTVQSSGAGTAHNNMQPFLALVYCIATQGIFPSRP